MINTVAYVKKYSEGKSIKYITLDNVDITKEVTEAITKKNLEPLIDMLIVYDIIINDDSFKIILDTKYNRNIDDYKCLFSKDVTLNEEYGKAVRIFNTNAYIPSNKYDIFTNPNTNHLSTNEEFKEQESSLFNDLPESIFILNGYMNKKYARYTQSRCINEPFLTDEEKEILLTSNPKSDDNPYKSLAYLMFALYDLYGL